MESLLESLKWLMTHGTEIVGAITTLLSGLIAISLLIPGEQPEKFLQSIVDWLSKISRKNSE